MSDLTPLKRFVSRLLPETLYFKVRHRLRFGRWPSLASPVTFNEHLLRLMVDREASNIRRVFADKLAFRDYVVEKAGEGHLPEILKVFRQGDEIRFEDVDGPFVMKATHGSGLVKIALTRSSGVDADLKRLAQSWIQMEHYWSGREYIYLGAERRIILEEFLKDPASGGVPPDYKLFTFRGETRLIQLDLSRFEGHQRLLLTPDWQPLDVKYKYDLPQYPADRPKNLDNMIELARTLTKDMSFVRVDLYDLGDRIVVGELTNFPEASNGKFEPDSFDYELGSYFNSVP
jgi:hypothetical protein